MAEVMLDLAAVGVDVLRLDAVPFLWKRTGTNSQNQPEVHDLLQAFRSADADRRARPSPSRRRRSSRRATSSATWARGATRARSATSPTTTCSWCCCGARSPRSAWSCSPASLRRHAAACPPGAELGHLRALPRRHRLGHHGGGRGRGGGGRLPAPALPRRLLRGRLPRLLRRRRALPARPAHGRGAHERDGRVARRPRAALATGDALAEDLAVRRILLLYAVAFAHGGVPLVYMGDELGLRNDHAWATIPAHRDDNRWMHRPRMDWAAAERRHDPASVEGRLWAGPAAASSSRAAVDARGPRAGASSSRSGRATTTSSGCCASTPASGCCCWPTSRRSRSPSACRRARARARHRARGRGAGRPPAARPGRVPPPRALPVRVDAAVTAGARPLRPRRRAAGGPRRGATCGCPRATGSRGPWHGRSGSS